MKKFNLVVLSFSFFIIFSSGQAEAVLISVDAAPNVYGSPDYPTWKTSTYSAVAAGTFTNMSNGINPLNIGTTNFEIQDEVVYSFGDLGKRLTWIYWIPNETVASLSGRFKVSLFNTWDGYTWDFYDYYYSQTWLEPTKWEDYAGGVIGASGMAWWGAYGVNTQAALDADLAAWGSVDESWTFSAKLDGKEYSITSNRAAVPEPSTLLLIGVSLAGFGFFRRARKKS